jgi:hypothetical protein
MNKKIKTTLFVFIIIGVVILNFMYKNKNEETKIKKRKQNNLAIMIKDAKGVETNSNTIPIGNYKINEEKTHCENNGKVISYDNTTGKIGFSFIGSDRCYLFFEVVTDTEKPVISNLTINGKTISATLTDNEGLLAYGFSTSNLTEPTSWTTISGKTYNLNTTINTEGTYYLWVKDGAGNKAVSNVIDLEKKGWQTILANNTVNETTPDFSKVTTASEKGLYKADDDYTATTGMKSYYFRGAVDNNWVKFGKDSTGKDIYWRIIRINGDGSIRMIYTGTTAPKESTKVVMTGEGTQIGKSAFNSNNNRSEYVGYMYTVGQQYGTSTSSTIKIAIDNWYKKTTLWTNLEIKDLVADEIYCNDRSAINSAWSSTGSDFDYASLTRMSLNGKPSPSLKCTNTSDKFTVDSSNGNGALTYPVGLISVDEVAMAGGKLSTSNSSYYLYTGQDYWINSPTTYSTIYKYAYEFLVYYSGIIGYNKDSNVNGLNGIRPVISLSSDVILSGDGTYSNVYTVS